MVNIQETTDQLHQLILINNDRVKWYEHAIAAVKDVEPSLAALFEEFAEESRLYANELDEKINLLGSEDGIHRTTLKSKLFSIWSDIKATFSHNAIESILASSEYIEDRVQESYNLALKNIQRMDEDSLQMIEQQQAGLKDVHDKVKLYRDELKR